MGFIIPGHKALFLRVFGIVPLDSYHTNSRSGNFWPSPQHGFLEEGELFGTVGLLGFPTCFFRIPRKIGRWK